MKLKYSLTFLSFFTLPSFAQSGGDCQPILIFPKNYPLPYPDNSSSVKVRAISLSVTAIPDLPPSKQLSELSVAPIGGKMDVASLTLILSENGHSWTQPLPYTLTAGKEYQLEMAAAQRGYFTTSTWKYSYKYFTTNDPNKTCTIDGYIELKYGN